MDLTVPKGSVYALLGNNGTGKSTTIRILLGLLNSDAGTVRVLGQNPSSSRQQLMHAVGALVESPSLYPQLTGIEYLRIGQLAKKLPYQEVQQVLELVNLSQASQRKVANYSLGMRQRLGLANALMGSPELLVLDEPTNGLDPTGMQEIRNLLRRLPEERGTTVFVSSHLLDEVEKIATHVGLLSDGRLKIEGPLSSILSHADPYLSLSVSKVEMTIEMLVRHGYRATKSETGNVHVFLDQPEAAPEVHRLLFDQDIDLFESRYQSGSLEQAFHHLTRATLS